MSWQEACCFLEEKKSRKKIPLKGGRINFDGVSSNAWQNDSFKNWQVFSFQFPSLQEIESAVICPLNPWIPTN